MRVLIVTQYFAPEVTSAAFRLEPIASGLESRGLEVEVLCEIPSHPRGVRHDGYGRGPVVRERVGGERPGGHTVSRVWTWARPAARRRDRLLSYASYAALAVAVGAASRRPDVVFASSPPLSVGAVGLALARRFRVPLVLDVRDPWPDAAVAVGEISAGTAAFRIAKRLERRLYRGAAAVTTTTRPFVEHVAGIRGRSEGVVLIPNGTTREWLALGEADVGRDALGVPSARFAWTYCGNVGLAQGLDAAVDAAAQLGDGFELVVVGDGPRRAQLEARARERQSARVTFRGLLPRREAGRAMRASDALLVPLSPDPAFADFVPAKLFDATAVGRPVVLAARGEAARLAAEADAAVNVEPGDAESLAAAIRELRDDPGRAAGLAARGREFAAANQRDRATELLAGLLDRVAEPRRAGPPDG